MKILRLILLFMILLNITHPKGLCSTIVDVNEHDRIDQHFDSQSDSTDDQSTDHCQGKKVDAAEKFFTPQRFNFSQELTDISYLEVLPTFKASYLPTFNVPPAC